MCDRDGIKCVTGMVKHVGRGLYSICDGDCVAYVTGMV